MTHESVRAGSEASGRRWIGALVLIWAALIVCAFAAKWNFGFYDLFSFQPRYADTVALLAAGQARHAGLDVYGPNPLDPLHRAHVYGPGWLISGALGLTVADARWLGPLLIAMFVATAAMILAPRGAFAFLASLALVCSPPVMLGVDRANNDLVVFLLLATSAAFLCGSRRGWAGSAVLALGATLKLYPLAAAPLLVAAPERRRTGVVLVAGFAAICGVAFWLWRDDYRQAIHHAPRPETLFAYGLPVTVLTWRTLTGANAAFILAFSAGVGATAAVFAKNLRSLWHAIPSAGFSAYAFVGGAACWVFCFCTISSFPYRFVLLLLPARLWLMQARDLAHGDTARRQLLLWIGLAWLTIPKQRFADAAATDSTLSSPAWTSLKVISGLEQGAAVVLTAALACSLVGWWVRRIWPACVVADQRAASGAA